MKTLSAILVPVDGSPASLSALDHAVALANDYDARIEVLHVVPRRETLTPITRTENERAMDDAITVAQADLGHHRVTRTMAHGDPVQNIVDRARDRVDLIVMGTHGRTGRLHAMLGSVAEAIVRNAPCPVLTIRDPRLDFQPFAERRHRTAEAGPRSSYAGRR